jgi:hypothetical protein
MPRSAGVIEAIDVGDARIEYLTIKGGKLVGDSVRGAGIHSAGDSRLQVF